MVVVGLRSAPVAMNNTRLRCPDAISGRNVRAEHTGRTAAAASTRMGILPGGKDLTTTVKKAIFLYGDALFAQQFNEQVAAKMAQITCDDQIVVFKASVRILQVGGNGIGCRGAIAAPMLF